MLPLCVPGGHLHGRGAGVLCINPMMFVHYNSKHTKAKSLDKNDDLQLKILKLCMESLHSLPGKTG